MKRETYRFRQFAAFFIDWNLAGLPSLVLCALLILPIKKGLHPIAVVPVILAFPVLFLNRDRLFRGRSPGNRLMNLVVLDRRTLQPLTGKALVTRNLFFLFGGLDVLLLLLTGTTLGDRSVAALVVPEDRIPDTPPRRAPADKKTILRIVTAVVLCFALFLGMIQLLLNRVKDEPHYALAHSFLLESEALAQLGAEADDVRLTGYNRQTVTHSSTTVITAAFTFYVKGHQLTVVCTDAGEGWYVNRDLTALP